MFPNLPVLVMVNGFKLKKSNIDSDRVPEQLDVRLYWLLPLVTVVTHNLDTCCIGSQLMCCADARCRSLAAALMVSCCCVVNVYVERIN